jgi:c-di-GMP-binding flagellar brake protein YcgR
MFQDTRPASLDDLGDPTPDEFRVTDPVEVRTLLRALLNQAIPLNLSASDGSALRTTLWSVDAEHDKLSFTADLMDPHVHDLVEADEAVVVAYLDKIKLQFDVPDLMLVQGQRASVLQARLPRELFRFQRRNTFRVRTIERAQSTATFRHPAIPDMTVALRVLDVSIGGCALLLPGDVPSLAAGVQVTGVKMSLDADTTFDCTLMLHHVTSTGSESGSVRLGCGIQGLGGSAERALQRYIDQTQKRRRMMALD